MSVRKRYAIVGVGARSRMFQDAIFTTFKDNAQLVAVCDANPARLDYARSRASAAGAPAPRAFAADAFDAMLAETRPDALIVATIDATHDAYIARALAAGLDVLTEKPMTTTPEKTQRVLDACAAANKHIRVTFNYRYSPPTTQLKDILMSGAIGDVLSVEFAWLLNTSHGADYFRRWHGAKANSGGLAVHKATHHFDLVNWWLSAAPESVRASGRRAFYTPATARRLGLSGPHERCATCPEAALCPLYFDLSADPAFKAMYADAEKHDGYFRDRCVWREDLDIEDTLDVAVGYDTGAMLSYSLCASAAWEGFQVAFNGVAGRLEHRFVEQTYATGARAGEAIMVDGGHTTRLIPLRGSAQDIEVWSAAGGHGGGDPAMLKDLFAPDGDDPYLRAADERAGAYAMLVGAGANRSMESGAAVRIGDLVCGLGRPDYPQMPARDVPIPPPPRANWRP